MNVVRNAQEVVYSFEEFINKIDKSKPRHYDAVSKSMDSQGFFHRLIFKVYGIALEGHIIVFEIVWDYSVAERDKKKTVLEKLIKEYAEKVEATPGRWEIPTL